MVRCWALALYGSDRASATNFFIYDYIYDHLLIDQGKKGLFVQHPKLVVLKHNNEPRVTIQFSK